MDERWQQIERIYHAVREIDGSARADFLAKSCAGDESLRREVESLLQQADQAESFLQSPAIEVAAEHLVADGSFLEPSRTLELGTMVAHYRLTGKLGEGGMGEVYRARDTKLQRDVALKILPEAMSSEAQRMGRFEREAQVLASLNHPNIAAIHGLEITNGVPALVMELVEGPTLAEQIHGPAGVDSRPVPVDEALAITRQIAEALEYAHEHGVVHRDLKPANIKITPEGTVKVLDFGLAKVLTPPDSSVAPGPANSPTLSAMATQAGMILGTAAYMSPEQVKGQRVDRRADIWAFGCVLFEMLTGRKAFDGETISDILAAVLTKEPDWSSLPDATPEGIRRLIRRCLQKDVRQRLQAIGDARIAIEETLAGDVGAHLAPGGEHSSPLQAGTSDLQMVAALLNRHRGKVALFAAFIAAIIVVGGYLGYQALRPTAGRQQAASPASSSNMQITQLTTSGTAILAAISPGGRYVAYAQQDAKGQSLWLRQVATGSAVEIVPPSSVEFIGLTFSPDGNYLDYVQAPQSGAQLPALYQAPVLGGQTHKLLENVGSAVAFSPDGKQIAFVRGHSGGETQLVIANADGSGERVLASRRPPEIFLPTSYDGRPAWSPDGRVIAVSVNTVSSRPGWHPAVFDVRTGQERRVGSRQWFFLEQLAWQPDGKGLLLEASDTRATVNQARDQIWQLSYPSGRPRRITNDLNDYRGVSVTSDGAALATVQTRLVSNIWAARKGEWDHPRQVTHGLSNVDGIGIAEMSWTAGGKIVYASAASGTSRLWLADPASGHAGELIQQFSAEPSACGNAGLIVFDAIITSASGGISGGVWRANEDGSGLVQVTHGGGYSSCSPDGRWVVYVNGPGNPKLWKVPINGGKPVQITEKGASYVPRVSPDDKLLLYYHSAGARSPWRFTLRPFAGGKVVRTFPSPPNNPGGSPVSVAWLPGSRAFAYVVQKGGVSNVVEQPIDGGPVRQLTHYNSGRIFALDVSRDGKLALALGTESNDVVLIKGFQ